MTIAVIVSTWGLKVKVTFMDKTTVAKTLLTAFSSFGTYIMAAQKTVNDQALRSFSGAKNTYDLCNSLIDQIYESRRIADLKEKLERLLEQTPERERKLLLLYYVHDMEAEKIAPILKVNPRSVFRYLKKATAEFAARLEGVVSDGCFNALLNEQYWVRKIYNRVK